MKSYLGKVIMRKDGPEDSSLRFCESKNGAIDKHDSAGRLKGPSPCSHTYRSLKEAYHRLVGTHDLLVTKYFN